MLQVIDHNEPIWGTRYNNGNRENGAATYSRDIVAYQIPVLEKVLDHRDIKVLVSTCPMLHQIDQSLLPKSADMAIQYIHTYPYDKLLKYVKEVIATSKKFTYRMIFITAYKQLHKQIVAAGGNSIFVPMSIDTRKVRESIEGVQKRNFGKEKHAIYFGNVTTLKGSTFEKTRDAFKLAGWKLDYISDSKFNGQGERLTQDEAWRRIAQYEYGVGVGRCALEMMSMGLKVMISGAEFGGLMTDESEFEAQLNSNLNGRIITFNRDILTCVKLFDLSITNKTSDSRDAEEWLLRGIGAYLYD